MFSVADSESPDSGYDGAGGGAVAAAEEGACLPNQHEDSISDSRRSDSPGHIYDEQLVEGAEDRHEDGNFNRADESQVPDRLDDDAQ